jgi:4-hydroxybenzoate polyprenyltransferase
MNAKSVTALSAALITLATGTAAYASGAATNKVFISGPLILLFLGFCALVVVAQIIPVISTLYGMIKGTKESKEEARAEAKSN